MFDDGSGSLVGTHYRTADISATAKGIEAFVVLGCLLTHPLSPAKDFFTRVTQLQPVWVKADMARGQNILLLGGRGSGKSAIVRALGGGKWPLG